MIQAQPSAYGNTPMWRDESELRAPAIVISSLGGLVYGKDGLTAKDEYRARMLRQALRAQLGRPRGPPKRGQTHVDHEDFASEICHRSVASPGSRPYNENSTWPSGFCSPAEESHNGLSLLSNPSIVDRINTRNGSHRSTDVRATAHMYDWECQGQIGGERRDCLEKRRRARATGKNASGYSTAPNMSVASSLAGSSCAGTEVSLEGLVDELRVRLPQGSTLAELAASEQTKSVQSLFPKVEAMVSGTTATFDQQEGEASGHSKDYGSGGACDGDITQTSAGGGILGAPPRVSSGAVIRHCNSMSTEPQRGGTATGLVSGCLDLRYPIIRAMRTPTNVLSLTRTAPAGGSTNNARLKNALGVGPQPSVVLPPGGTLFPDGSTYRLVMTGTREMNDVTPSAAMVATAKAHERALPLLQVCAAKVIHPTVT